MATARSLFDSHRYSPASSSERCNPGRLMSEFERRVCLLTGNVEPDAVLSCNSSDCPRAVGRRICRLSDHSFLTQNPYSKRMSRTPSKAHVAADSFLTPLTASMLRAMLTWPLGSQAKELAALLNCDAEQVRRKLRAAKTLQLVDVEPGNKLGPAEWFLLPIGRDALRAYDRALTPGSGRAPPVLPNVPNSVFSLGAFVVQRFDGPTAG